MKDTEEHTGFRSCRCELTSARGVGREGLVGDDVDTARDRFENQCTTGLRWRRDGDGVDAGVEQVAQRIEDRDVRVVRPDLRTALWAARDDTGQLDLIDGRDVGRMEEPATGSVSDETQLHASPLFVLTCMGAA